MPACVRFASKPAPVAVPTPGDANYLSGGAVVVAIVRRACFDFSHNGRSKTL